MDGSIAFSGLKHMLNDTLLIILAIVGIAFAVVTDSSNETDAYPVDYITNFVYLLTYLW